MKKIKKVTKTNVYHIFKGAMLTLKFTDATEVDVYMNDISGIEGFDPEDIKTLVGKTVKIN